MDFIEQIKHLLWNWDSWECILMKIIKGKWIFIMLFLTLLTPQHGGYLYGLFGAWALYSDYCMVCFFRKAFLKSDKAVALRRHNSCIFQQSFSNVYYVYSCKLMWLSAKSTDVFGTTEHNAPMYTESFFI